MRKQAICVPSLWRRQKSGSQNENGPEGPFAVRVGAFQIRRGGAAQPKGPDRQPATAHQRAAEFPGCRCRRTRYAKGLVRLVWTKSLRSPPLHPAGRKQCSLMRCRRLVRRNWQKGHPLPKTMNDVADLAAQYRISGSPAPCAYDQVPDADAPVAPPRPNSVPSTVGNNEFISSI